ncbi:MAG: OmpH family outer membrane protein [Alphaproteobacteria bacterium]|nr:OmpH family outer membrane protein [Alphaproteobacteria bacterium]
MNKFKATIIAGVAAASLAASPAVHAETHPLNFAIVDMNKVMREATAGDQIRTELTAKSKQFHTELENQDKTLSAQKEALAKSRESMTEDAFEKKVKELQGKYGEAERLLQERRRTLDVASNTSRNKLLTEATKLIADIAKEKGYSAVFTQEAVLLAEPELDITDEVVKRMNTSVKKIAIDWNAANKAPVKQ